MTVVETGTRALLGAVFGAPATGEIDYARRLLPLLRTDMLVLVDRGFDAEAFLTDLAGTGAQFLARLRNNRTLPVLARLDDGSHLSRLGELAVRIITADPTVSCADGTRYTATYRLATTLCDPRRHPAGRLIAVRAATGCATMTPRPGGRSGRRVAAHPPPTAPPAGKSRSSPAPRRSPAPRSAVRTAAAARSDRAGKRTARWQSRDHPVGLVRAGRIDGDRARGALVHGLRHSFATELADSGVSGYKVMKLLGRESMVTSQRYVTAPGTETRTAAAQNRLYDLLEKPPQTT